MIDPTPHLSCPDWAPAAKHLSRVDPVLKTIIRRAGVCTLAPRRDYFPALCQSIINQQISTSAARAIYGRFRQSFQKLRPTPAGLLGLNDDVLRAVGLSRQKVIYLRCLATGFAEGQIPVRRLNRMTDEEIIDAITPIKGIGRWTVEMFMIFLLNRPDVLPVDDLGLRKNVQIAYGLDAMPTAAALREMAEPWRPYRSIATWYLWKAGRG